MRAPPSQPVNTTSESTPPKGHRFQWNVLEGGKVYCVTICSDGEYSGRLQVNAGKVAAAIEALGLDVISVDVTIPGKVESTI